VGGLLAEKDSSGVGHFPVFDGNGNVARLVAGNAGTYSAAYEYGPFGETIRASGSYASSSPIRFSTKYWDGETELYYYGHRYYTPSAGRWLSRDPIEEDGGLNLYLLADNSAQKRIDPFGLEADWDVDIGTAHIPPGNFPGDPKITILDPGVTVTPRPPCTKRKEKWTCPTAKADVGYKCSGGGADLAYPYNEPACGKGNIYVFPAGTGYSYRDPYTGKITTKTFPQETVVPKCQFRACGDFPGINDPPKPSKSKTPKPGKKQ
jgi:RHS repeat-associated protein